MEQATDCSFRSAAVAGRLDGVRLIFSPQAKWCAYESGKVLTVAGAQMCKRLICKRIAETRDEAKDILGVAVRGGAESVPSACPRIFPHTG